MAATRIELSICLIIEVWSQMANPGSHSGGHGFESRQLRQSDRPARSTLADLGDGADVLI